jgi:ABC-type nitrate/sulfonate/bicarbonate transport system substrate-binding protein
MDRPQAGQSRGSSVRRRRLLAVPPVVALCGLNGRPAVAAERVRVGMLKPNIVTVIYWIAVKTGAFEKNGLTIVENPVPSGQTSAGIEQLLRGGLDFYIGASGEVAHVASRYVEAGKPSPIALVEGGVAGGSFFILRDDLKGKSLDELRAMNLRIGLSNPSSYHLILFRAYLRAHGMTTDDFQWRFLTLGGPEMLPAMVSRQLDGFMHDALTTTLALRAKTGFVYMSSDRGDMGAQARLLPGTGVCGNAAFIRANVDVTRRFTQALRDASAAYASEPRPMMVATMAEWSRQDPAVIDDMFDRFNPRVGMTPEAAQVWWDLLGSAMVARGEISAKLKLTDVFDLDYLRPKS